MSVSHGETCGYCAGLYMPGIDCALGVDKFSAYWKKKPRLWPINKDGALAISWNITLSAVVSWLVSLWIGFLVVCLPYCLHYFAHTLISCIQGGEGRVRALFKYCKGCRQPRFSSPQYSFSQLSPRLSTFYLVPFLAYVQNYVPVVSFFFAQTFSNITSFSTARFVS